MKLYINTKKMTFDEENNLIEHEIVFRIMDTEFYGYDKLIKLSGDDKFLKDTLKITYKKDKKNNDTEEINYKQFKIREEDTWWSFPLYEIIDDKIVSFDYTKYQYFANTDRRVILGKKICNLYNIPSELKILRKTLKTILDHLGITDEGFEKYNMKVEAIINKNPKGGK